MKKAVKDEQVQQLQEQLEDAHNKYLRALADYQNLEKRMGGALEQARLGTRKDVVSRFIDVLDDLEKAEVFVQDPGLKMIMDRFKGILQSMGVEEIEVIGSEYDPYTSEALEMVHAEEGQKNHVVEVVRKGYKIGDTIIRPAQVKVGS